MARKHSFRTRRCQSPQQILQVPGLASLALFMNPCSVSLAGAVKTLNTTTCEPGNSNLCCAPPLDTSFMSKILRGCLFAKMKKRTKSLSVLLNNFVCDCACFLFGRSGSRGMVGQGTGSTARSCFCRSFSSISRRSLLTWISRPIVVLSRYGSRWRRRLKHPATTLYEECILTALRKRRRVNRAA